MLTERSNGNGACSRSRPIRSVCIRQFPPVEKLAETAHGWDACSVGIAETVKLAQALLVQHQDPIAVVANFSASRPAYSRRE